MPEQRAPDRRDDNALSRGSRDAERGTVAVTWLRRNDNDDGLDATLKNAVSFKQSVAGQRLRGSIGGGNSRGKIGDRAVSR